MLKKKNNRYSIFIKLMLLFLVFILLANFSIGFILSRIIGKGPPQGSPERFPVPVQKYIISRIGDPPDTNLARRVSDELQVNFRIESSGIPSAFSCLYRPVLLTADIIRSLICDLERL